MVSRISHFLAEIERSWGVSYGSDISTEKGRARARRHYDLVDHGLLRKIWTNYHEVDEGVFRSNQPSQSRLADYKERGIKSVLNLRGESPLSHYLFEEEACRDLGLTLVSEHLSADTLPTADRIFAVEAHLRSLEKPLLFHCKSGADRAGFVAALYLLLIKGAPVALARQQLSFRYLHLKGSKKGVLDYALAAYAQAELATGIRFRDWLKTAYDPDALKADFLAGRGKKRLG